MSHVLVVLGSARKGRVADKVLGYVQKELESREGVTVTVADLKKVNLPFFDNELSPASPDYVTTDEHVLAWSKLVNEADSVLFITPEYNHTLSAIQKNAFDSLHKEWAEKHIAIVAYGWSGGSRSIETLTDLIPHLGAVFMANPAQLTFMKDLNPDGSTANDISLTSQIKATIDEIA
ncbi:NAD(P)H-dependent oxidoreductase [Candidatus Saccharibacteria bacterium]|nr:NAD(P)H-dependent oxidoreductase [Candidatus Saccharibacteria bacterium]